ncbi:MAG: type II toxin-antitoxin system death-on-curing family toxin [Caldilineaceae bacterium SB0665_bin_21]|nr:type II toxin-antitoxin system death-on-curing family toxin [Caldilineaceae bacterium SB0665_bin_21]
MSWDYLTLEEIVVMHDAAVHEFGGTLGIRDTGALAAAVMRPQIGYYDTLIEEAAALMESLAMNHPFLDGNKRIAFYATDVFLRKNGSFIDCDNNEAHRFFMKLFKTNAFRFEELHAWLQEHVKPLSIIGQ